MVYVPKVRYVRRGRRRAVGRRAVGMIRGLPPTATAALGAAVLAHGLEKKWMANWNVAGLGVDLTVGLGAWLAGKWTGWPILRHMATGILSVAAYKYVTEHGGILGADVDIMGEDLSDDT
jgi:hypothetical protein